MALGTADILNKKLEELENNLGPDDKVLAESVEIIIDKVLENRFLNVKEINTPFSSINYFSTHINIRSFPTNFKVENYITAKYLAKGWRQVHFTDNLGKKSILLMS